MDPNLPNTANPVQQPVAQPQPPVGPQMQTVQVPTAPPPTTPVQPQNYSASQSEHNSGLAILKIILVLIIIVAATAGLIYAGIKFLNPNKPAATPRNANVFVEPTVPPATPTPSVYQLNPNDTSDNALNQDTQVTTGNLNNLDSAINDVNQSLNDQQTNLQ